MTYISGLRDLQELKKDFPNMQTVLYSIRERYTHRRISTSFCR